jgi:septal ring factor EnvC (AmiA/AmiB activator)
MIPSTNAFPSTGADMRNASEIARRKGQCFRPVAGCVADRIGERRNGGNDADELAGAINDDINHAGEAA